MAPFIVSSFGLFVIGLLQGLLTAPSWQTLTLLACGWALASERHPITVSLWLTGATTVKHFSRCYVFLGQALYQARRARAVAIAVHVGSRLLITGKLYALPPSLRGHARGVHLRKAHCYDRPRP